MSGNVARPERAVYSFFTHKSNRVTGRETRSHYVLGVNSRVADEPIQLPE